MTVSRNPSISLSDHHRALVDALVESGRYHGVSEVVREGRRRGRAGLQGSPRRGRARLMTAMQRDMVQPQASIHFTMRTSRALDERRPTRH